MHLRTCVYGRERLGELGLMALEAGMWTGRLPTFPLPNRAVRKKDCEQEATLVMGRGGGRGRGKGGRASTRSRRLLFSIRECHASHRETWLLWRANGNVLKRMLTGATPPHDAWQLYQVSEDIQAIAGWLGRTNEVINEILFRGYITSTGPQVSPPFSLFGALC